MRERVGAAGLTLRVERAPGAGCRVTVEAPIPERVSRNPSRPPVRTGLRAMLLVAILQPGEGAAILELVGADRDACLVIPLGDDLPAFTAAALPLAQLPGFAARAARRHRHSPR